MNPSIQYWINEARDSFDVNLTLGKLANDIFETAEISLMNKFSSDISKITNYGKSNLEAEQLMYKHMSKAYKKIINLFKITIPKDEQKKCLVKKDILKKNYGVNAYLSNDADFGEDCIKAMDLMRKNGYTLPNEIIACPNTPANCSLVVDGRTYIIVNPDINASTNLGVESVYDVILHEGMHVNQPNLYAFTFKKIPTIFKEVADNISNYARENYMHEVDAELKKKKILGLTNKKEDEFFDFLNFGKIREAHHLDTKF